MKRLGETPTYLEERESRSHVSVPGKLLIGMTLLVGTSITALVYQENAQSPVLIAKKEKSEEQMMLPEKKLQVLHDALHNKFKSIKHKKAAYQIIENELAALQNDVSAQMWENIKIFCIQKTLQYPQKSFSENVLFSLIKKKHLEKHELELFAALLWQKIVPVKEPELR